MKTTRLGEMLRLYRASHNVTLRVLAILEHPSWPTIRPYVVIQHYGRDVGPRGVRWRIEVCPPNERAARTWLALEAPCCADCGREMHPFRQRRAGGLSHVYFACACPLEVDLACSRGRKAADEYLRVRSDVEQHEPASRSLLELL